MFYNTYENKQTIKKKSELKGQNIFCVKLEEKNYSR